MIRVLEGKWSFSRIYQRIVPCWCELFMRRFKYVDCDQTSFISMYISIHLYVRARVHTYDICGWISLVFSPWGNIKYLDSLLYLTPRIGKPDFYRWKKTTEAWIRSNSHVFFSPIAIFNINRLIWIKNISQLFLRNSQCK